MEIKLELFQVNQPESVALVSSWKKQKMTQYPNCCWTLSGWWCTYLSIKCFNNFNFTGFWIDCKVFGANQSKCNFAAFRVISFQRINYPSNWCGLGECQVIHILCEYGWQIASTWQKIDRKLIESNIWWTNSSSSILEKFGKTSFGANLNESYNW